MTWLDLVFVGVIVWFTATAAYSGMVREVIAIAAVILGVVLAGRHYNELAQDLTFIDNDRLAHIAAFGVIFGAVTIAGHTIALLIRRVMGFLMLAWLDRAGGAAIGFLKGSIIVEVFLIVVTTYPYFGLQNEIAASPIASFYLELVPVVLGLLPHEFRDAVEQFQAFH